MEKDDVDSVSLERRVRLPGSDHGGQARPGLGTLSGQRIARIILEQGLDLTDRPEGLAYCDLLDEALDGEQILCDGLHPCSCCQLFLHATEGIEYAWACSDCLNKLRVSPDRLLGFYATGEGAAWSNEEPTDVTCELCGRSWPFLQAARTD
jgi:hypothetical protein